MGRPSSTCEGSLLAFLGLIAVLRADRVAWSVCLSVSPAKTAEPIKMPFGVWIGSRNHVLDGGRDPCMGRGNFKAARRRSAVKYSDALP